MVEKSGSENLNKSNCPERDEAAYTKGFEMALYLIRNIKNYRDIIYFRVDQARRGISQKLEGQLFYFNGKLRKVLDVDICFFDNKNRKDERIRLKLEDDHYNCYWSGSLDELCEFTGYKTKNDDEYKPEDYISTKDQELS